MCIGGGAAYLSSYKGFTLAEVLITLGIIGIVAAITIPAISSNIQKTVLKNQFKKMYATLNSAFLSIQTENGMPIRCFYWESGTRPDICEIICKTRNEYGNCIERTCQDGSPLPSTYRGLFSDCDWFSNKLFYEKLKTQKICLTRALENGCLTDDYRGSDKVRQEQNSSNPDYVVDPNVNFSDVNIKNKFPVIILTDGTLIVTYGRMGGSPVFLIDVNGHKGPNKWGYDIFTFKSDGNSRDGIKGFSVFDSLVESGGKNFNQMKREIFK